MKFMGICLVLLVGLTAGARAAEMSFRLETGVPGQDVEFVGDLTEWNLHWMPMSETSPGVYETHFPEPWLTDFEYGFSVDGHFRSDPLNPNSTHDPDHGKVSVEKTHFQEDPELKLLPNRMAWVKKDFTITDYEGAKRVIQTVAPPQGFFCARTMEVFFQDGQDYLDGGVGDLLANLSAEPGLPCLVGVFIDPIKNRETEYTMGARSDRYTRYLIEDVIPKVETRLNLNVRTRDRALVGASLGGLYTLNAALRHSDVFGIAIAQSGSYWWNEGEILATVQAEHVHHLKVFLDMGIFEGEEMLSYGHEVANALEKKPGVETLYKEYPSTHDWIAWPNRLREILTAAGS